MVKSDSSVEETRGREGKKRESGGGGGDEGGGGGGGGGKKGYEVQGGCEARRCSGEGDRCTVRAIRRCLSQPFASIGRRHYGCARRRKAATEERIGGEGEEWSREGWGMEKRRLNRFRQTQSLRVPAGYRGRSDVPNEYQQARSLEMRWDETRRDGTRRDGTGRDGRWATRRKGSGENEEEGNEFYFRGRGADT